MPCLISAQSESNSIELLPLLSGSNIIDSVKNEDTNQVSCRRGVSLGYFSKWLSKIRFSTIVNRKRSLVPLSVVLTVKRDFSPTTIISIGVGRHCNAYEREQHLPKLMLTDKLEFIFKVVSRYADSNSVRCIETLLDHRNEVECRMFLREEKGTNFLRLNLSHEEFSNKCREPIIQDVVRQVRQMLEDDESSGVGVADGNNGIFISSETVVLQLNILLVDR